MRARLGSVVCWSQACPFDVMKDLIVGAASLLGGIVGMLCDAHVARMLRQRSA